MVSDGRLHTGFLQELPKAVACVIQRGSVAEFATISKAGVPIDSPTLVFSAADLKSLDVATGLAYPAKADRARRNPKVGMLFEGSPGEPVVSVAGMAAVRDADLQANLDRYLSETILSPPVSPQFTDWSITQQAAWYLTRIIICVTPCHIRWWNSAGDMDQAPHEWRAPADLGFPASDPAPAGMPSAAPNWPQIGLGELVEKVLANKSGPGGLGAPGHLTLLDDDGFPLSFRVDRVVGASAGFRLEIPKGLPLRSGIGTLSFGGVEVFVGHVEVADGIADFVLERALPILPLADQPMQVLQPTDETKEQLMARLRHETARRGQTIPKTPAEPPLPTEGARIRVEAAAALMAHMEAVKSEARGGQAEPPS